MYLVRSICKPMSTISASNYFCALHSILRAKLEVHYFFQKVLPQWHLARDEESSRHNLNERRGQGLHRKLSCSESSFTHKLCQIQLLSVTDSVLLCTKRFPKTNQIGQKNIKQKTWRTPYKLRQFQFMLIRLLKLGIYHVCAHQIVLVMSIMLKEYPYNLQLCLWCSPYSTCPSRRPTRTKLKYSYVVWPPFRECQQFY